MRWTALVGGSTQWLEKEGQLGEFVPGQQLFTRRFRSRGSFGLSVSWSFALLVPPQVPCGLSGCGHPLMPARSTESRSPSWLRAESTGMDWTDGLTPSLHSIASYDRNLLIGPGQCLLICLLAQPVS